MTLLTAKQVFLVALNFLCGIGAIRASSRQLKMIADPDEREDLIVGVDSSVSQIEPLAASTTPEVAWMVTAIIFIVLFALAIILVIYLWYLRNSKIKELRALQTSRDDKNNRNVWYGGSYI